MLNYFTPFITKNSLKILNLLIKNLNLKIVFYNNMKLFSFIILFIKNIQNYGYFNSVKIIFFEIYYFLFFRNLNEYRLIENKSTSYLSSKYKKKYNTGYLPTPYYFLKLMTEYLKKNNIKNFNFIDLGCGYSRPAFFLLRYYKFKYIGFEINKKLIQKLSTNNFKIICLNLRKQNRLIQILKKNTTKNDFNIFFIADPFDINLVNEILLKLKKKKMSSLIVLTNINYKKLKKKHIKLFIKKNLI